MRPRYVQVREVGRVRLVDVEVDLHELGRRRRDERLEDVLWGGRNPWSLGAEHEAEGVHYTHLYFFLVITFF